MQPFFEWNQSLDLGIGEMNDEHQQLISLMNRLHEQHREGAPYETLAKTLTDLKNFTIQHFQDEEAYMMRINYPKLETHQIIHKKLISRLGDFANTFASSRALDQDFFEFLQFWLSAHIRGIDMQYAHHAKAQVA